MLQMMQKKVEAEGDKEKELFEKFQCYCDTSSADLTKSIEDAEEKIPQLESEIKEATATEGQLTQELADHKTDREEATKAIEEATQMRNKEAKAFASESSDMKSNIAAIKKAIPAIEGGMSKDMFLQTDMAVRLRTILLSMPASSYEAHQALQAFLSTSSGSSSDGEDMFGQTEAGPSSGEILGILKQMGEDMAEDLEELIKQENDAVAAFDQLKAAKDKEIAAASKAIEEKTARLGDVRVQIVELKNDLEDSQEGLANDQKLFASLKEECALRTKDYEAKSKTRSMELLALSDTIKLLNDDDAMELFKKTLPSPSFLQTGLSSRLHSRLGTKRRAALQYLRGVQNGKPGSAQLMLITGAVRNQKVSFAKVTKMIDDMVTILKEEQAGDDKKKEYC